MEVLTLVGVIFSGRCLGTLLFTLVMECQTENNGTFIPDGILNEFKHDAHPRKMCGLCLKINSLCFALPWIA